MIDKVLTNLYTGFNNFLIISGIGGKMGKKRFIISITLLVLFLSGCVSGETIVSQATSPQETEAPTIHGKLTYSSRPINGAKVSLEAYRDEACVKLSENTELSEGEEQELDECTSDYATTTSNAEGNYEFSDVEPGWYKLMFDWVLDGEPDSQWPFEIVNDFLISYYETESSPKKYSALAQSLTKFYFTGEEDIVIDF
jgi:hypothetical protein